MASALLDGSACYHLYFIVIAAQFYLLFPLLMPALRLAERHLEPVVLALSAGYFGYIWLTFLHPPSSHPAFQFLLSHQAILFPAWSGFFLVGAYVGLRLERTRRLLDKAPFALLSAAVLLALGMTWEFLRRPPELALSATTSLRPLGVVYSVVASVAILALARLPLARRGWFADVSASLARHSFGVYLLHPLFLTALGILEARAGMGQWNEPPHTWIVALNTLVSLAGTWCLSALLSRFQWTGWLVGQKRRRPRPSPALVTGAAT